MNRHLTSVILSHVPLFFNWFHGIISDTIKTMHALEQFFVLSLLVQLVHSLEELSTGFHKKWYLFSMPFWVFLSFEVVFSGFWFFVLLHHAFPYRSYFQAFFLALMFANGVQHIVWWGSVKKYVPGLATAFVHIAVFLVFYFRVLF